jgi:hypothetical protein
MHQDCWECKQLWRTYYATALEQFASQERIAAAARMSDPETLFRLRLARESAAANAELVLEDLAAHRKWHARAQAATATA